MDIQTKDLIDKFIFFLSVELKKQKDLKHIQLLKWSLNNYKLTARYFLHDKQDEMFFDLRELKDNQNHFTHLLVSAIEQIHTKNNIKSSTD